MLTKSDREPPGAYTDTAVKEREREKERPKTANRLYILSIRKLGGSTQGPLNLVTAPTAAAGCTQHREGRRKKIDGWWRIKKNTSPNAGENLVLAC